MSLEDELKQLNVYLKLCIDKEVLTESIWLAFKYKKENPDWDLNKCIEHSIWNWLLINSKKESKLDFKSTVDKINQINQISRIKDS